MLLKTEANERTRQPVETLSMKRELSDIIAADIARYIAQGGQITSVPMGLTSDTYSVPLTLSAKAKRTLEAM